MNKITKKLGLIFLTTISVTSLAGCNTDEEGITTIKLGMWPQSQLKTDVNMFNVWKTRFETDYPEYKIEPSHYTYDPVSVAARGMSNTLPTVFQTWNTEPEMLIKNKYIRDVTDLVKEVGYYDDMDSFMKNVLTFDNKLYGIPRDGYGFGMCLNLNMLWEYDIIHKDSNGKYILYDENNNPLYPTTFDQLAEWGGILEEMGDQALTLFYAANSQGGWLLTNLAWNFGSEVQTVDPSTGAVTNHFTSDGMLDALEYIRDMKINGYLLPGNSYTYNDWHTKLKNNIAVAFCGNDVVQNAVTMGGMNKDDIAFVPMPAGPKGDRHTLFGGTPFVFAKNATDEQVKGALLFLEYMGRSPKVSEVQKQAMVEGKEVSKNKNEPILKSITPWTNASYLSYADELDEEYVNVDMSLYQDFFDNLNDMRKEEPTRYPQEMYETLDQAVLYVIGEDAPTLTRQDIKNKLVTLQASYEKNFK